MQKKVLDFEKYLWERKMTVAGFDEAGRGSIAGPLVVAGVILPVGFYDSRIQDSKKMTHNQRLIAFDLIKKNAVEIGVIVKDLEAIERENITGAANSAVNLIYQNFNKKPDICLTDGKDKVHISGSVNTLNIIAGDNKSINIAAASIIAKVTRDKIMFELHKKFPVYEWNENKGYFSKSHLTSIIKNGICEFHRKSYEPIKTMIKFGKQKVIDKYLKYFS